MYVVLNRMFPLFKCLCYTFSLFFFAKILANCTLNGAAGSCKVQGRKKKMTLTDF